MASYGDARINSRPPPTNTGQGLFGRLLQRTRSKKERKPVVDKESFVPSANTRVPEPRFDPSSPKPLATPQPARLASPKSTEPRMGFPAVHHQQPTPAPMLRKKASIRDRFRSHAKETPATPDPIPAPEKKRTVYVPKHAAADFSRMALSPRPVSRQQQRFSFSYDEPRDSPKLASDQPIPEAAQQAEDEAQAPLIARHYSQRGLETLDENEPVRTRDQTRQPIPETEDVQPVSHPGDSHQQGHGEAAITDFGNPSSPNTTTSPSTHAAEAPEPDSTAELNDNDGQQPSDYELFLARAEERERAYREHLLRTLSQRQYPRPEPEAAAHLFQPRNSGAYTADSAVVADASNNHSNPPRKVWEGRPERGGLDSGIGSKSSSQQTKEEAAAARGSSTGNTWERGHRKRGSWTPSFGAGRDAERRVERDTGVVPEEEVYQGGGGGTYTTSRAAAAPSYGNTGYVEAAQQPRTLKRQTSIKQKLGAYIKPARPPTRYEEPELSRGESVRRT